MTTFRNASPSVISAAATFPGEQSEAAATERDGRGGTLITADIEERVRAIVREELAARDASFVPALAAALAKHRERPLRSYRDYDPR